MAEPKESFINFHLSECPVKNEKDLQHQIDLVNILDWEKSESSRGCSCGAATINSDIYGRSVKNRGLGYFCHLKVETTYNPEGAKQLEKDYRERGILVKSFTTEN